jgi:predicted helicase
LYRLADNLSREIEEVKASVELILKELNSCAIEKIRNSFYKENSSQEPILYFYETFLREYDKETKKKRGAYYTPKPVVAFIVKSIDTILAENFSLKDGFLNDSVKVLDPATGTGTFLASAIELIKTKIDKKYQILGVEKEQFIKEVSNHILHNFYAFEFMIAPYTVAHLKLTLLLRTLGFDFSMTADDGDSDNDRFKIYLANTLDDPSKEPNNLFGFSHIAEEGKKAKAVKNQKDIIAIIGNPPYSGSSQNPSRDESKNLTWIGKEIEAYKFDGAKKLDEKNPKWLQDDYVKFIRFAEFQINSAGYGAIGYIVPHGFLDNPTFRYMRKSLMNSFTKIYILDLHGNDNKKELDLDGNKDENVFDIKQGVCIALFVKEQVIANEVKQSTNGLPRPEGLAVTKTCEVYHGDLYGKREDKFHTLQTKTFKELCTNRLNPSGEMSYFIPRSEDSEYESFWSVKDIFKINGVGITTAHDEFVIDSSKENLIKKFEDFKNSQRDAKTLHKKFDVKEKIGWDILKGYDNLQKIDDVSTLIQPISYRPFDSRYIIYEDKLVWRTVKQVLKHMLKDNLALVTRRQSPEQNLYSYMYLSNHLIADGYIRSDNKGGESGFPLYLYDKNTTSLFEDEKTTNFTDEFRNYINTVIANEVKQSTNGLPRPEGLAVTNCSDIVSDEDIFYYIYGLLYSPTYRTKYNEFLKTDFPRIDFSYDIAKISKLGFELTQLHLLTHDIFDVQEKWNLKVEGKDFTISFAKKADIYKEGKIYLNPNTFINGVDEATFKFMIGGYQVLDKWLSDRKNKTLNIDELLHYLKIIVSLRETIKIMGEIDKVVKNEQ